VKLVFATRFTGERSFILKINIAARQFEPERLLARARLVTTDEVLAELLDGLARRGPNLRQVAALTVRRILADPRVTVHAQSRESFLGGLRLYEQRFDKGYSLVDCVSMTMMRRYGNHGSAHQ